MKQQTTLGSRYKTPDGAVWQLVSYNDIGCPYFSKVRGNKVNVAQYVVPWLAMLLDKQEEA